MSRRTPAPLAALVAAAIVLVLAVSGVTAGAAGPAPASSSGRTATTDPTVLRPVASAVAAVRAARQAARQAVATRARARARVEQAEVRLRSARGAGPVARAERSLRQARRAAREANRAVREARRRVKQAKARVRAVRGEGRKNVVVFLLDDMRADEMVYLPRTRRLLSAGLQLTDAVSAHPLCCPARAQLLTGQYAQNNGVRHNSGSHGGYRAFDPSSTLGTSLRQAGYTTALHGKYLNGYRGPRTRHEPGWDVWDALVKGPYDYRNFTFSNGDAFRGDFVTDRLTRRSLRTLTRAANTDEPFFVLVSHPAPHHAKGRSWGGRRGVHHPPVGSPRYQRLYAGTRAPSLSSPSFGEADLSDKPRSYRRSEGRPSARNVRRQHVGRAAALRSVDDGIATTLKRLRKLGELRNTYVVVTSDNGYTLGEHRSMGKNTFYDEVLTVPMLISGPGVPATASALPVTLADLSTTIMDLAGARPAHTVDGVSFARALTGGASSLAGTWRDTTLLLAGTRQRKAADQWGYRGVRTSRYTYGVAWHDPSVRLLFDRRDDPHELTSVHDDPRYAAIREELHRRTMLLSDCAGAACNRRFGPLPAPRG